jgi:uncharacterized protein YhjY with autotransporter beta-barrel domain
MRYTTTICCLLLAGASTPAAAQTTASEALDSAWVSACAGAVPGTAFYDRCQEILNAGPGSAARRSAAAIGNNLEIFAAQARLMMRMAKARGRAAARAAEKSAEQGSTQFQLADLEPEGDTTQTLASGSDWSVFGSAGFSDSTHNETGFERGYGEDGRTLLVGAEYRWHPQWSALLGLSRERGKVDFAGGSGRLDSRTDQATLALNFVGARSFSASLAASAGRLHSDLQREINYTLTLDRGLPTERQVTIRSRGESDNSAHTRGADLDLGWDRGVGAWTLHFGGGYSWLRTEVERIVEDNDKGLDFLIVAQKVQSQRAGVEFQAARAISTAHGVWQPYLRLRWMHEYGDDPRRVFAFFRGGNKVVRLGFDTGEPDRDFGEASLGVVGVFPRGWQVYAGWQHSLANDQLDENRLDLGWRREF